MACFTRQEDGATALEFAVVSPALFLLVIGVMEAALIMTAQLVMEAATFSASRVGKTGYLEANQTQEETIRAEIGRLGSLLLDTSRIEVSSTSYEDFSNVGQPEPFIDANNNGSRDDGENYTDVNGNGEFDLDQGSAGYGAGREIVVYTMDYDWRLFTPLISSFFGSDGEVRLSARTVVKNEPF